MQTLRLTIIFRHSSFRVRPVSFVQLYQSIMREICHLQAGQCGNQIGAKVIMPTVILLHDYENIMMHTRFRYYYLNHDYLSPIRNMTLRSDVIISLLFSVLGGHF